jgi:hypothetical protein
MTSVEKLKINNSQEDITDYESTISSEIQGFSIISLNPLM